MRRSERVAHANVCVRARVKIGMYDELNGQSRGRDRSTNQADVPADGRMYVFDVSTGKFITRLIEYRRMRSEKYYA